MANGDRIKDKQRSKNSFVTDMDKKLAAENLLQELTSYHGAIINQVFWIISQIKLFILILLLYLYVLKMLSILLSDETNGGDLYQAC